MNNNPQPIPYLRGFRPVRCTGLDPDTGGPTYVSVYRFENGYGASVVSHGFSYGLELAVIRFDSLDPTKFELDYTTHVAGDVLGWLTPEELADTLTKIKALPAR